MLILDSSYVSYTPDGIKPPSGLSVMSHNNVHGIDVVVCDNDPYYTVHFVKLGKSIAREGMIDEIDKYLTTIKSMSKSELLEKLGVL